MLATALILVLSTAAAPAVGIRQSFLYGLSSFTGPVHSTWAALAYDRVQDEVVVAHSGVAGIFNRMGMEVHEFGGDGSLGLIVATAVLDDGDLIVISNVDGRRTITRCDYRGEILAPFELKGLPAGLERTFEPDLIAYRGGKLYLGESSRMNVVVTDNAGKVLDSLDLKELLKLDATQLESVWMRGLSVDRDGRILATLPLLFKVALISTDRTFRLFGNRGSSPGKFNIIGKMVSDERGFYYLTDTLRAVVMVFDPELKFLGEFGYRGDEPGNLVAPVDIAVGNGKVFVAQAGNRGVSVFKVELPEPPPPTSAPATPPPTAAPR